MYVTYKSKENVTEKPSVFAFQNFREYLYQFYMWKKSMNSSFSYRVFANKLGKKSEGFIRHIINGKRNLTLIMASKFARYCELSPEETRYFISLTKRDKISYKTKRIEGVESPDETLKIEDTGKLAS